MRGLDVSRSLGLHGVAAGVLALVATSGAMAAPITFGVTGRVTAVVDDHGLLDGSLQEGGAVDARYTVDEDDAGGTTVVFGDGLLGRRPPTGTRVAGGNYRAGGGSGGNVTFFEPCVFAVECSELAVYALVQPLLAVGGVAQTFEFELLGLSGSLFSPPFWKRLDGFETRRFSWTFSTANDSARVEGVVVRLQPVPEPSTLVLLASGVLLGLGQRFGRVRRFRSRPT